MAQGRTRYDRAVGYTLLTDGIDKYEAWERWTGLGLAIARSAVVMHRGAIKVFSQPSEGTTFTVRIPLNYVS